MKEKKKRSYRELSNSSKLSILLSQLFYSFIFFFICFLNFLSMCPLVALFTYYYHISMIRPSHSTIPISIACMMIISISQIFNQMTNLKNFTLYMIRIGLRETGYLSKLLKLKSILIN